MEEVFDLELLGGFDAGLLHKPRNIFFPMTYVIEIISKIRFKEPREEFVVGNGVVEGAKGGALGELQETVAAIVSEIAPFNFVPKLKIEFQIMTEFTETGVNLWRK